MRTEMTDREEHAAERFVLAGIMVALEDYLDRHPEAFLSDIRFVPELSNAISLTASSDRYLVTVKRL